MPRRAPSLPSRPLLNYQYTALGERFCDGAPMDRRTFGVIVVVATTPCLTISMLFPINRWLLLLEKTHA